MGTKTPTNTHTKEKHPQTPIPGTQTPANTQTKEVNTQKLPYQGSEHPRTPTHTREHPPTPANTRQHPPTPANTRQHTDHDIADFGDGTSAYVSLVDFDDFVAYVQKSSLLSDTAINDTTYDHFVVVVAHRSPLVDAMAASNVGVTLTGLLLFEIEIDIENEFEFIT